MQKSKFYQTRTIYIICVTLIDSFYVLDSLHCYVYFPLFIMSTLRRRRGDKEDVKTASSEPQIDAKLLTLSPAISLASPSFLASLFVFAAVLAVYALTTYPSVTGGDAGELIITGCNLGVAHPPGNEYATTMQVIVLVIFAYLFFAVSFSMLTGYPTFTMLAGLFQRLIPIGQKAWRTNMMSSLFGAIAAVLLYRTGKKLGAGHGAASGGSGWGGMLAALGFAFSPTVWLYSIQGEVFALNNLLVAAMVYLTVLFYEEEDKYRYARQLYEQTIAATATAAASAKDTDVSKSAAPAPTPPVPPSPRRLINLAYLGAFICGLAMTNQHTTVFPVLMTSAFVTWSLFWNGQLTGKPRVRWGQLKFFSISVVHY